MVLSGVVFVFCFVALYMSVGESFLLQVSRSPKDNQFVSDPVIWRMVFWCLRASGVNVCASVKYEALILISLLLLQISIFTVI